MIVQCGSLSLVVCEGLTWMLLLTKTQWMVMPMVSAVQVIGVVLSSRSRHLEGTVRSVQPLCDYQAGTWKQSEVKLCVVCVALVSLFWRWESTTEWECIYLRAEEKNCFSKPCSIGYFLNIYVASIVFLPDYSFKMIYAIIFLEKT